MFVTRPFFVALLIQKLNSKPAFAYWVAIFFQNFFWFFLDIFWGLKNGSYWWYLKNRKSDLSMSVVFFVAPLILNLNSKPAFAYRIRIFFQNFFWIFWGFFFGFFQTLYGRHFENGRHTACFECDVTPACDSLCFH